MKILVANIGSSSKKYALYDNGPSPVEIRMEGTSQGFRLTRAPGLEREEALSEGDFAGGAAACLDILLRKGRLRHAGEVQAVGLRVVAPGTFFQVHRIINDAYMEEMERVRTRAPLHIEPALNEARALRRLFPGKPLIGVSDSEFHSTLPEAAREYALPMDMAERWDVHRFGYHGISGRSILRKLEGLGNRPERIVLCHLGSGASITAIRDGKSADTSMGFTPLEGLIMGTRAGDLDPAAVLFLERRSGMDAEGWERFLNTRCGLLGMSGASADMRRLLELESAGDGRAALAVDAFVYRARKQVGAMAAALGGIDLLVFTGAMGERSPVIRARICAGMEWMGIRLDREANAAATGGDMRVQARDSSAGIAVLATEELEEMAVITGEHTSREAFPSG